MSKITYADKEYIYENAEIPEINKITDGNMNEIKSVVNENDTRLTTAEGEIDTAQTDINNAEAVIGNETDTYSASSTYALGSLVIYNSLLYKCTTAITVAEAWTIAHWTQVSLTSLAQSGEIYSTTEQKIGTDTNGKPIYRKSFVISGKPTFTSNKYTFNHNIDNFEIVDRLYGRCYDATNAQALVLPYAHFEPTINIALSNSNTTITVEQSIYGSNRLENFKITIEYTKTTD